MAKATCVIEGRIGQDPKIGTSATGTLWTRFSVAVTERVRNGDDWEDGETTWYNVVCFKGLAEMAGDLVSKGDLVVVTGRMRLETYEGDNGTRSSIAVVADSVGLMKKSRVKEEAPF